MALDGIDSAVTITGKAEVGTLSAATITGEPIKPSLIVDKVSGASKSAGFSGSTIAGLLIGAIGLGMGELTGPVTDAFGRFTAAIG